MKKKRLSETSENKQKQNEQNKEYMRKKRSGNQCLQSLILKFHDIVSKGPLYVCSCCDQMWYKHNVSPAATLWKKNPDIKQYLQDKRSVNDVEWLCKSCQNYLAKYKVPPCVAINGMQFPMKPALFDLNELECRLLAPRLAFEKLMQAPRGKQLKISGNVVNVPADITNTVSMLPRLPLETGTIKVNLRWLPMVLFSYNRIYRDQTLFARITRGMFVASYNIIFHIQS